MIERDARPAVGAALALAAALAGIAVVLWQAGAAIGGG